ncbi:3-hydroxyacyl-ACP dehydratase FabZ family protein [Nocardia sp. NPDC057227]|uniref:3-hydroxyacyl-ACP dehydratase FabZ family protein n=1 Tax=Nocardia sp. NPDC057227 TaxID=3346056 RepID=UPI00363C6744
MTAAATYGAPAFDAVEIVRPGECGTAVLNVTGTLPVFAAHFPRYPTLPGMLLLEGGIALIRATAAEPMLRLREARGLRFRRFVVPGDQVRLTVRRRDEPDEWELRAEVAGEVAAVAAALRVGR